MTTESKAETETPTEKTGTADAKSNVCGRQRVHMLDTIRGVIIIGVVGYHLLFDLWEFFHLDLWWMKSAPINFIRDFGAGTLILISGISSRLSHSNLLRGVKTVCCALALSIVTYFAVPDNFIFFGILHFLGLMMLVYGAAGKWINKIPRITGFVICFLLFFFFYPLVTDGCVGIPYLWEIAVPKAWQVSIVTNILGFGGGTLVSADYFPILPWSFLFLSGTYLGNYVQEGKIPRFLYRDLCRPVTFLGRNTLIIYLLHQPILYGLFMLLFQRI